MDFNNINEWGPYAWYKFHEKAMNYPANPSIYDINNILNFYHATFLRYVTCESCRQHYEKLIIDNPVKTRSRATLFMWTVDIHNIVNIKLRKKQMGYNEAYRVWCSILSRQKPNVRKSTYDNNMRSEERPYLTRNNYHVDVNANGKMRRPRDAEARLGTSWQGPRDAEAGLGTSWRGPRDAYQNIPYPTTNGNISYPTTNGNIPSYLPHMGSNQIPIANYTNYSIGNPFSFANKNFGNKYPNSFPQKGAFNAYF
jgi:hypothetical protein